MKTMVSEERNCPMCAEVMDLTDRQFEPCNCGYKICAWCWHHIMEMAEKDGTEGCCPACCSPYDKERILGMRINSERLIELKSEKKQKLRKKCKDISRLLEVNNEKHQNLQKETPKPLDWRKDLETARVIQRKIVYLAGIPASLANEETVRKKEFLGQYGKVKRIIIPQPKQQYPSTRVAFVTFSKEEEAVRCIQALNGFILDGCPLKACFGALRYCDYWLKNMTCKNQDCFLLHQVGAQEDTCTPEDVISACASKFEQCSGISLTSCPRRQGSFFPPPVIAKDIQRPVVNGFNSLENSDSGASPMTTCDFRTTHGLPPPASVRASEGPHNHPNMSSSSVKSDTGLEVHSKAQPSAENRRGISFKLNNWPSIETQIVKNNNLNVHRSTEARCCSDSNKSNHLLSPTRLNDSFKTCTFDETKQSSSCRCSWCVDGSSDAFSSASKSPITSLQNVLPDITLSSVPQAVSSSEDLPLSYDRIRKYSGLELTGFPTKPEAKNMISIDLFPTDINSTVAAQKVDECSTYSAARSRISLEGQTSQSVSSERDSDDLESRFVESCNSKHLLVEKSTVQGSVQFNKANVEIRVDNILSPKAHILSKAHSFISDISSLDTGLADHLVEPHRLAKQFGGTNKKGNPKERFDSQMASDGNESRYSSARMENDGSASGELFSLDSNPFDVGRNYNVSNNSEVAEFKHNTFVTKVENEFERSSLNMSASPLPVPRNVLSYPPGFYPRYPADQNQPMSMPTLSGHSDQYQLYVNPPRVSYSENRFRSSTLNLRSSCGVLPSTISLHSAIPDSNLGISVKTDARRQAQSGSASFTQNSMSSVDGSVKEFVHNVAMQETKNWNGHNEACNIWDPTAAASGVTGISGYSETLITNNEILDQQFLTPFHDYTSPQIPTPNFSYFSYSL